MELTQGTDLWENSLILPKYAPSAASVQALLWGLGKLQTLLSGSSQFGGSGGTGQQIRTQSKGGDECNEGKQAGCGDREGCAGGLFFIRRSGKSSPVRLILSRDINKVREQD